jgi:hypothetical protein
MLENIDLSIETDNENYLIKIQGEDLYELNIRINKNEIILLKKFKGANWENRKTIKAGLSANSNVFWAYNEDKTVSIMVGDDDETWDFAVIIPLKIMEKIFVVV